MTVEARAHARVNRASACASASTKASVAPSMTSAASHTNDDDDLDADGVAADTKGEGARAANSAEAERTAGGECSLANSGACSVSPTTTDARLNTVDDADANDTHCRAAHRRGALTRRTVWYTDQCTPNATPSTTVCARNAHTVPGAPVSTSTHPRGAQLATRYGHHAASEVVNE